LQVEITEQNMNDVIKYWNRGAEEQYGWTMAEAVGRVSHEIAKTVFPIPLPEIKEILGRTGRREGELIHFRRGRFKDWSRLTLR
jgi:PAS domain-containing protein